MPKHHNVIAPNKTLTLMKTLPWNKRRRELLMKFKITNNKIMNKTVRWSNLWNKKNNKMKNFKTNYLIENKHLKMKGNKKRTLISWLKKWRRNLLWVDMESMIWMMRRRSRLGKREYYRSNWRNKRKRSSNC